MPLNKRNKPLHIQLFKQQCFYNFLKQPNAETSCEQSKNK